MVINIRNLKKTLNDALVSKKFPRTIKFNQKTWLKSCTDILKKIFEVSESAVFEAKKKKENVRKHGDIKLLTTRKDKLFSIRTKLSYCKVFHIKYLYYRHQKTQICMNKPVYLGLSI